jgi:predicted transcriptional regulator of viral defense system
MPAFTTRDYATLEGISRAAASKRLATREHRGELQLLTRGVWIVSKHPSLSPFGCVPLLLGKEDGYVSFLSALHLHGVLSQIPAAVQVATTGHSRRLETPIGRFEFFKVDPRMTGGGVEWKEVAMPFRLASSEKALLDTLYLATRRGRRFSRLPELEKPHPFRRKEFLALVEEQVQLGAIKIAVLERFKKLAW